MKTLFKTALVTSAIAVLAAQPAFAQTRRAAAAAPAAPAASAPAASTGILVPGLAVANFDGAVTNTDAYRAGMQQRQVTYKPQIDAYQARGQALQAQLQPMVDKFNRDKAAPNANTAALQQQATAIQQFQESAQQELNELIKPVAYSEAYVKEQIEAKLEAAVRNAMNSKRISIVLDPQAVMAVNNNAYDLNPALIVELNRLIPAAQLVPPAGWEPRQIREARQQQAGAQGQPPATPRAAPAAPSAPAAPAGPPVDGR
jgi:Skp family chaperone for outer membrane proteins